MTKSPPQKAGQYFYDRGVINGEDVRAENQERERLRHEIVWFSPSPFMVCLLKELIWHLQKKHGPCGCEFLNNIEATGTMVETLENIDGMSGSSICDLLEEAIGAIPRETLVKLGVWEAF